MFNIHCNALRAALLCAAVLLLFLDARAETSCIHSIYHEAGYQSSLKEADTLLEMINFPTTLPYAPKKEESYMYFKNSEVSSLVLRVLKWSLSLPTFQHNNRNHCVEFCEGLNCGSYSSFIAKSGCFTDVYADQKETQDKNVFASSQNKLNNQLHVGRSC
jgi:hypothetical protein